MLIYLLSFSYRSLMSEYSLMHKILIYPLLVKKKMMGGVDLG
jgi:hypothetical protein